MNEGSVVGGDKYPPNEIRVQYSEYSRRPNSECSDFGAFRSRLVVKQFRFWTVSEIRTISFGFWMFDLIFHTKLDRFIKKIMSLFS